MFGARFYGDVALYGAEAETLIFVVAALQGQSVLSTVATQRFYTSAAAVGQSVTATTPTRVFYVLASLSGNSITSTNVNLRYYRSLAAIGQSVITMAPIIGMVTEIALSGQTITSFSAPAFLFSASIAASGNTNAVGVAFLTYSLDLALSGQSVTDFNGVLALFGVVNAQGNTHILAQEVIAFEPLIGAVGQSVVSTNPLVSIAKTAALIGASTITMLAPNVLLSEFGMDMSGDSIMVAIPLQATMTGGNLYVVVKPSRSESERGEFAEAGRVADLS